MKVTFHNLNMKISMDNLLSYIFDSKHSVIYISIGCANIRYKDQIPPLSEKQQYPPFLEKMINDTKLNSLIILIDPNLEEKPYIFQDFKEIKVHSHIDNLYVCNGGDVNILTLNESFNIDESTLLFFNLLNQHILDSTKLLMVHSFAGHEIGHLMDNFIGELDPSLKETFLNKILYDLTYGLDHSCLIDLNDEKLLPVIQYEMKNIPKIVNYHYHRYDQLEKNFTLIPSVHLEGIFKRRKTNFRRYTMTIFRQIKMIMWSMAKNQTPNINQDLLNRKFFNVAGLYCFDLFEAFMSDSMNLSKVDVLHDALNLSLLIQTKELSLFYKNKDTYFSEIYDLILASNDKNIYTLMNKYYSLFDQS